LEKAQVVEALQQAALTSRSLDPSQDGADACFFVAIGIVVAASALMFVFLCVSGYMWASSK
jgi:hypothetical protein